MLKNKIDNIIQCFTTIFNIRANPSPSMHKHQQDHNHDSDPD